MSETNRSPMCVCPEGPDKCAPACDTCHRCNDDTPSTYRKTSLVRAVRMKRAFEVVTLEGVMHGEAGDYLCEGPAGERWPIKKAIFEATYEYATGESS